MRWRDVPAVWQRAFQLAWDSHLEGSNPIASVIVDPQGEVIAVGKSAVRAELTGVKVSRCEIAHAEVNALFKLDNREHPKAKASDYTLYVTM